MLSGPRVLAAGVAAGLAAGAGCTPLPKLAFNEPPSAPTVAIDPAAPFTTDTLTARILTEAVDPEGVGFSYRYDWLIDGSAVASGLVLDAGRTTKGQIVTLSVVADDGEFQGEPGEASVTIANSPPAGSTATISPANPLTTDDLTVALDAEDLDGDVLEWTIAWSKGGVEVVEHAGKTILPASATASGESWTVEATPRDDDDAAGPVVTATVRIDDTAPTFTGLQIGPTDVKAGETLGVGASGVVDVDGDTVTMHYTWTINAVVVAEQDGGATEQLTTAIYRGDTVSCTAYATDGQLSSGTLTSNTLTVNDTAPTIASVTLSPDPGHESDTLSCTAGGEDDVDGDTVRFTYAWQVNASAVAGSTSSLTGSSFSRGDAVSCQITPYDDDATGTKLTSNEVDIENTPPSITTVTVTPTTATAATTLTSSVAGWYDADGDSQRVSYAWLVDGTVSGASANYTGLVRGQEIVLEVTPNDGYANGTPVDSSVLTVSNATPTLSSVSINPSILYNDSSPTAVPSGYADADNDTASYRYQWYVQGAAISGETDSALVQALTVGEQIQVRVWPSDGITEGSQVSSSVLTVSNRTPVAGAELLTTDPIETCDEIQLTAAGSSDLDGTPLDYSWTVTTRPAGAHRTTSDLDTATDEAPYFIVDADGSWTFRVSASDGTLNDTEDVAVDVEPRAYNSSPAADAGTDQATSVDAACSTSSGYGTTCVACPIVTFGLDAGNSTDADGDPLDYEWTMAPTSGVTLTDSDSGTPTLSIGGMIPTYDLTTTVSVTLMLSASDCAEGSDTDTITVTYECMGI